MKREKNQKAGEVGIRDLAHLLEILPLIPLVLSTLLAGKTLRPFLSELVNQRLAFAMKQRVLLQHKLAEAPYWVSIRSVFTAH